MNTRRSRLTVPALLVAVVAGCSEPARVERAWTALSDGTELQATVYSVRAQGAEQALDEMRVSVATFSTNTLAGPDGGTLGQLNREAARDYFPVQDLDLYRCVLLALDYGKVSEGAFDPTIEPLLRLYRRSAEAGGPTVAELGSALGAVGWQKVGVASEPRAIRFRHDGMALDLGGVAKGFTLDVGARVFARPGLLAGLVRLGGNAYAWQAPPDHAYWKVGLTDPRDPSRPFLTVGAANQGVAVSGRRGMEEPSAGVDPARIVLDPRTGQPAAGDVIAAVALADSAADADALATALHVAGSTRGAALLKKMRRVEAILLVEDRDGTRRLIASPSLEGRIELSQALARETGGEIRYLLPGAR